MKLTRSWCRLVCVEAPERSGQLIAIATRPAAWWVTDLRVAEASRGQGIGSALLARFIEEVGPHTEVGLIVKEGDDAARRLYARHGFRAVAATDAPVGCIEMMRWEPALVAFDGGGPG